MEAILVDPKVKSYSISSARRYTAVTKHDTTILEEFKALFIGGEGDVKVGNTEGDAVTFSGLAAGTILPVYGTRVYSTGTTATLIVALRD